MNARNAALFGAHREELLARFAGYDADQQIPELDRLMILLHEFQARPPPLVRTSLACCCCCS